MRARSLPRLAGSAAALAFSIGSPARSGAQARPAEPAVPEQPLPPGTPGLPQLPPDSAGAQALAAARQSPPRVVVRDAGPGSAGSALEQRLAARPLVVDARDSGLVMGRAVSVDGPLVVLGDAHVAGTVRGDLVVVGTLYLRPGALVEGHAIAVGGRVVPSTLASVRGQSYSYDDLTVDTRRGPDGTLELRVAPIGGLTAATAISLPGIHGFSIPLYTRIDGLALTFGPEIRLDTGRVRIEPRVTYRSHLGVFDPGLLASAEPRPGTRLQLLASRGTFSNDVWIRTDLLNSALAFGVGTDARNYYRADRGELTVVQRRSRGNHVLEPFVGALLERSWSAARDTFALSVPYSVLGRDDVVEGMRRPNPPVTGGTIGSALAGVRWRFGGDGDAESGEEREARGGATLRVEQALTVGRGAPFTQGTLDGIVALPGFKDHIIVLLAHAVGTLGPEVPSQRWAYVGGSGTIPSLLLLEQGGAQLVWAETRYVIPLRGIHVPLTRSPVVTLRHIVGGAGERHLPALTQNLGIRLAFSLLRLDYVVDPSGKGRNEFSFGVGLR